MPEIGISHAAFASRLDALGAGFSGGDRLLAGEAKKTDVPGALTLMAQLARINKAIDAYEAALRRDADRMKELGALLVAADMNTARLLE